MFKTEYDALCSAATAKRDLLLKNPLGYLISSMVAGMFIAFGSFVSMSIGGILTAAGSDLVRFFVPLTFAAALSLVVMAGCELFTGNNLVLSAGAFKKKISWGDAVKLWLVCYLGNFIGSWIMVGLFELTGFDSNPDIATFFANTSAAKMSLTPMAQLSRGILCNICVCLAVWCATKLKSESGKLIMIVWCILIFMICGFEHSIANMSILGVGLLHPMEQLLSVGAYFQNLFFVTIGNMVGGIVFVAVPYLIISKEA